MRILEEEIESHSEACISESKRWLPRCLAGVGYNPAPLVVQELQQ